MLTIPILFMIEHQINGYLARKKDAEDLAQGIRWCIDNNKDSFLAKAAEKKVMEIYTIERVGLQNVELYELLLN